MFSTEAKTHGAISKCSLAGVNVRNAGQGGAAAEGKAGGEGSHPHREGSWETCPRVEQLEMETQKWQKSGSAFTLSSFEEKD